MGVYSDVVSCLANVIRVALRRVRRVHRVELLSFIQSSDTNT